VRLTLPCVSSSFFRTYSRSAASRTSCKLRLVLREIEGGVFVSSYPRIHVD
jgi:hypothetical protein